MNPPRIFTGNGVVGYRPGYTVLKLEEIKPDQK